MALNLKNAEVERLAAEVARLAGESKTEAVRRALQERRDRLAHRATPDRSQRVMRYLMEDLWPLMPATELGRKLTAEEEDAVLGYGPEGT
jgi:antitoxin VapB